MNPTFYFLLASTAVLAVTAHDGDVVLDIMGDTISSGSYYVLPRSISQGGGLTLAPRGDSKCPLYVGQQRYMTWGDKGIPVKFSTAIGLLESQNTYIKMDVNDTRCAQPTYWNVPDPGKSRFVVAGPEPTNGFFRIKDADDIWGGYMIVFCMSHTSCYGVGKFEDTNGVRRLAIGSPPHKVIFMRVPGS